MKDRCREIRELIPEFVTGSLATDKMITVSHHVGQCIPCREYLLGFEADDRMLCAFAEAMEPSVQRVEEQVLDALSRRRLARALGALSVFRRVATNKFVKVVAAAVIAVAAGIGTALLLSRPVEKKEQVVVKKIEQQPGETAAPAAVEQADIARAKLEAELKQLEQMFAAGDVDGLVAMLSKGSLFGKVFAASYLARIGDLRAVAALEKAKDQYDWPDENNPFAAAIDEIKSRAAAAKETTTRTEEPITYRGIVTDANGAPIEAVDIRSDLCLYELAREFKPGEADSRTNNEGRFEIGPLSVIDRGKEHRVFTFEHPDYAIGCFVDKGAKDDDPNALRIALLEPTIVAGRIVDEAGEPVAGALVENMMRLKINDTRYDFWMAALNDMAVVTDAEGRFVFEKVPEGARLHIGVTKQGYATYLSAEEELSRTRTGFLYPFRAGDDDLLIVLEAGGIIKGWLVLDGKTYENEGVSVVARGPSYFRAAVTDGNGKFEITGLRQGSYTVVAGNKELAEAGFVFEVVRDVKVQVGAQGADVEVVVQRGLPVRIQVIDKETGESIAKQPVRVTLKDLQDLGAVARDMTDDEGWCVVELAPGEYTVLVQSWQDGRYFDIARELNVKADSEDLNAQIAIVPQPMLYGWLVDSQGQPIRGTVRLGPFRAAETDEQGEFEVPEPLGEPAKIHICYAFDTDKKLGRGFLWQKTGDANDLEIVLEPLATITGRIVDENGLGVAGAKPELLFGPIENGPWIRATQAPCEAKIEPDGRFRFETVPVGLPMQVIIEKRGFERKETAVKGLGSGQVAQLEDIVLEALEGFKEGVVEWTGKLSGQVRDENDEPMVGIRVLAKAGGKGFNDSTDFKGRYMFTGLPKGKEIGLTVEAAEYGYNSFSTVCDGNDFDMQIFPEGYAPGGLEED